MMMGADSYETEVEMSSLLAEGKVPLGVGENTRIRCAPCDLNTGSDLQIIVCLFVFSIASFGGKL
jgi:glucose-1-phosphate adenylyltransferase